MRFSGRPINDQADQEHRRPRAQPGGDRASRPDRRAVGDPGTAAARRQKARRPPAWTKRQLLDGIRWQTVYGLFRRWQRAGVWAMILAGLQTRADAAGLITWQVSVNSTINRPTSTPQAPASRVTCRKNRGWLLVTAGQRGDSRRCWPGSGSRGSVVGEPGAGRIVFWRTKTYSARANRAYLRRRGIACTIPQPADQVWHRRDRGRAGGRPPAFDRRSASSGTRSSAASTGSNATEASPRGSTVRMIGCRPVLGSDPRYDRPWVP